MLKIAINKIVSKVDLSEQEAYVAMNEIMTGNATDAQIGGFLMALRMKGETIEEITGFAKAMRDNAKRVDMGGEYVIDTCGTGGDGGKTFNISSAAAIIASSAGIKVAKHGNRSVSSRSGSADVLSELGINIEVEQEEACRLINNKGMSFLFAQKYHSAMKNVAATRKELGTRTVFNILGPLTNPAFAKGQVLGIFDGSLTHVAAEVLLNLGSERALVVHGEDGLDEITTTGETFISELKDGVIKDYKISPEDFNIKRTNMESISGGTAKENSEIILEVLKGKKGPRRDIVVLNSAAALYVGKVCESLKEGVSLAEELIDSGKAFNKLQELRD